MMALKAAVEPITIKLISMMMLTTRKSARKGILCRGDTWRNVSELTHIQIQQSSTYIGEEVGEG